MMEADTKVLAFPSLGLSFQERVEIYRGTWEIWLSVLCPPARLDALSTMTLHPASMEQQVILELRRGSQPSPWVGPGKPNLPLGLRGKAGGSFLF